MKFTWMLSTYIILISLTLLSSIFFLVLSIVSLVTHQKAWNQMTLESWKSKEGVSKDFIQQAFSCCGFLDSSSSYTGTSIDLNSNNQPIENVCNNRINTLPPCYMTGQKFFDRLIFLTSVIGSTVIVVSLVSLVAANYSRKRKNAINGGWMKAGRG
jgi:hypothetical protein